MKKRGNNIKIGKFIIPTVKRQLLVVFLLVAIVPVGLLGLISIRNARNQLRIQLEFYLL
ncbi:hypothetical protein LJC58_03625 [Lachnospiraceae bacterium OttesenSCG-928-D06]|nr:hypothetical protein [Lachnospiraceae bacterium OttesenSCG-928-D06]